MRSLTRARTGAYIHRSVVITHRRSARRETESGRFDGNRSISKYHRSRSLRAAATATAAMTLPVSTSGAFRAPCVCESVEFCQVATQVSLRSVCRACCSRAFLSAWGLESPTTTTKTVGLTHANAGNRAPRTPMCRSTPSSVFVVGRRKLKQTDGGRRAQRSCWWLFHFHRAVFWPDRSRDLAPHPRKTVWSLATREKRCPESRTKIPSRRYFRPRFPPSVSLYVSAGARRPPGGARDRNFIARALALFAAREISTEV